MCLFSIIMLVGLLFIFKRLKGLLSCVPLVNTLKQAHTCELIFQKFMHIIQWKTQAKRLQAFSHMLTTILNIGVVTIVINGQAWDKITHYFLPLSKSYLIFELPIQID